MRKIQATLAAAAVMVGALAFGGAATAAPGPNGHNDFGLCKAYFAGSDKGKEQKRNAPPFVALETTAGDKDDVAAWCEGKTPGGK
jgi:Spy/CpxP family protein refolding chaperone